MALERKVSSELAPVCVSSLSTFWVASKENLVSFGAAENRSYSWKLRMMPRNRFTPNKCLLCRSSEDSLITKGKHFLPRRCSESSRKRVPARKTPYAQGPSASFYSRTELWCRSGRHPSSAISVHIWMPPEIVLQVFVQRLEKKLSCCTPCG